MTLRHQHRALLEARTGGAITPYIATGSKSMYRVEGTDAIILMSTGSLDRENRLACHVRTRDAHELLQHPGSALSCLWQGLVAPLVIPATVLEAPIGLLPPTSAQQHALKLRVGPGEITVVPTETPVTEFSGGVYLDQLCSGGGVHAGVPQLSHAEWQSVAAAIEHRCGCDNAIPANDRTRLDQGILSAAGLTRLDLMPISLRGSRAGAVDVVATPRGSDVPVRLIEIEHAGDIRAALHRCAQVAAHLEPLVGADRLPRVVIVADEARRAAYERYVREPLFVALGFDALCSFRSYAELYAEALRLLPRLPRHLRAA